MVSDVESIGCRILLVVPTHFSFANRAQENRIETHRIRLDLRRSRAVTPPARIMVDQSRSAISSTKDETVRSDLLYVVCTVSNPIMWKSRIRLYREFEQHMLESGVKLTTVEIVYGDRASELSCDPGVDHIRIPANGHALAWNKESALNLGIARLPVDAKYIATIDADVRFHHKCWAARTVHALQHYHVVQPWGDCYDLGPDGEHLEHHVSFCRQFHEGRPIKQGPNLPGAPYKFSHPGYAWAYTRQALEWVGGLVDTAALGAADHHMAMALIGRVGDSIHGKTTDAYKAPLYRWQHRAIQHIGMNIGFVAGTISHGFHGTKTKRAYVDRWEILVKHAFDPTTDLKRSTYGLIELAGNKPALGHDIDRYFHRRSEDANTAD
jgi:hypothetical protein